MKNEKTQIRWIATTDERHATLFSCKTLPGGRWHIEAVKSIENEWEDSHERCRPSALGRGPSANAAQHFASGGHEPEEEQKRFARKVRAWLDKAAKEVAASHIIVFAAPRFLGYLREEFGHSPKQVELHEAELTRLPLPDLIAHPAILRALNTPDVVKLAARR